MFVRRSRKGRIHVVRERVADGYARLSKGLARANKGVIDGVWSVHKGLQLGLAKGHQGVQSGLKTVQDFTGDFSMYYRRNSYYQYEEPMAMFSMAEVKKFDKYNQSPDLANFAARKMLPGVGKTSGSGVKGVFRRVSQGASTAASRVGDAVAGGAYAGYRATGAEPFRKVGYAALKNPRLAGAAVLGGLAAAGAAGVGGAMFLRRRRTKKGKVVVEQVRR